MSNKEELRILKYLEGSLDSAEHTAFEKEMQSNADLQSQVEEYRTVIKVSEQYGRDSLREKLEHISAHTASSQTGNTENPIESPSNQKKGAGITRWLSIAAILLLTLACVNFIFNREPTPEEIFTNNYQKPSDHLLDVIKNIASRNSVSRGTEPKDSLFYKQTGAMISHAEFIALEKIRTDSLMLGLKSFSDEKWTIARQQLYSYITNYKEPKTDFALANYFLAKAKLNDGIYGEETIQGFQIFLSIEKENDKLINDAEWESALCYLLNNEKKARQAFENIAGDNRHAYQDEAKAILSFI